MLRWLLELAATVRGRVDPFRGPLPEPPPDPDSTVWEPRRPKPRGGRSAVAVAEPDPPSRVHARAGGQSRGESYDQ